MHGQVARRISVGSVATSRLWLPLRIRTFELRATPGVSLAFETVDLTRGRRRLEFRTLRLEIRGGSGCPVLITRLINNAATSNGGSGWLLLAAATMSVVTMSDKISRWPRALCPRLKRLAHERFVDFYLPVCKLHAHREFSMKLCRAVSRCTVDFAYTAEFSIDRGARSASVAVRTFVFVGAENYTYRFVDVSRKSQE